MTAKGYLDASVLVGLFCLNAPNGRVAGGHSGPELVSDFAVLETSSTLARKVRTDHLTPPEAHAAALAVDAFVAALDAGASVIPADVLSATTFVRRLDLGLREPDALRLAIAQRLGAIVLTFDAHLAAAGVALGVKVVS